jgi:hypothetical protein
MVIPPSPPQPAPWRRRPAIAPCLLLLASAACLPQGDPPAGTRLVEERNLSGVRFSPAPGEAVLFSRRSGYREEFGRSASPIFDLWTVPARGGASARLVDDVDWNFFAGADSAGRLVIGDHRLNSLSTGQVTHQLTLIDPAGQRTSVGRVFTAGLSPGRGRLYYQKEDGGQVLREADGREISLPSTRSFETRFAGEALMFNQDQDLWGLPPDAVQPVLLVRRSQSWTAKDTSPEPPVTAFSQLGDPMLGESPMSLVLIRGARSRALMSGFFASQAAFAPGGDDRIAVLERVPGTGSVLLHVFHTDGAGHETFDLAAPTPGDALRYSSSTIYFRPGTREIWCFVGSAGLRIVRDDGTVQSFPDAPAEPWYFEPTVTTDVLPGAVFFGRDYAPSVFTTDGRFWLYRVNAALFLARADQPQLPGLLIQDRQDFPVAQVREVGDGRRMLIWAAPPGDAGRWDLSLMDVDTNQRRTLATSVGPSVVGKRRILALTAVTASMGDLQLIDLDTGADTLLAQNVTGFALPPVCPGCDATGPGASVVYVVHARIPFKYDGLWRLELP